MAKKQTEKSVEAPRQILNRKARFDYQIEDTYEAGLVLVGSEVKSIYEGKANLSDAYCRVVNGELFLFNADVEPYDKTSFFQHERRRDRKLLMHRREIDQIERKALEKGFSLVPLRLYMSKRRVKLEIGLGRGKTHYDKRAAIAKDDTRREADRARRGEY